MRIIEDVQLDYSDLLLMPQRSQLNSRKEVNIFREFKWEGENGSHRSFSAIPVMVANMVGLACPEVAKKIVKEGMMIAMEKHYSAEVLCNLYDDLAKMEREDDVTERTYRDRVFLTIGVKESIETIKAVDKLWHVNGIIVDVPNGYISKVIDRIKEIKENFPNALIIAGNVVTSDGTYDILSAGANGAKIGIGPGSACFVGDSKIQTKKGLKSIKDIEEFDEVLTHTGSYKKVINKFEYVNKNEKIFINDIECTPDHKFFVVKKDDISLINESNYLKYGMWIQAKDLDPMIHKLAKIQ